MKCPICDTEMQRDDDFMDFTLMEREDKCVDGCGRYVEHFIAGNYETGVKSKGGDWQIWQWDYNDFLAGTMHGAQMDLAIAEARAERESDESPD